MKEAPFSLALTPPPVVSHFSFVLRLNSQNNIQVILFLAQIAIK